MRKHYFFTRVICVSVLILFTFFTENVIAQCVPATNTVEGFVYFDSNNDGIWDDFEKPIPNSKVKIFDSSGVELAEIKTDSNGYYSYSGANDGETVKLIFDIPNRKVPAYSGEDNGTVVQFAEVPSCNNSFGMLNANGCEDNAIVLLTCFVQGNTDDNSTGETLISVPYNFEKNSAVDKVAMHGETGSVWGIAWHPWQRSLFSAAFVKQNSGLTEHGHDAIFKTNIDSKETELFIKLSDIGVKVADLNVTDAMDCTYGAQVGKFGLGSMKFSPDFKKLYVINISENELVEIDVDNPVEETTNIYSIPNPGCSDKEYYAFATKFYENELYIGVTCTAESAKSEEQSSAHVYRFNKTNPELFEGVFSTNYIKGFWNNDPESIETAHWLTDLDFTDEGNLVIALSDRIGHKYCKKPTSRLDRQNPDILIAGYDNGIWVLEDNARINGFLGAHPNNGEGPGGGEFFNDNWIANPLTDPETTIGSLFALPDEGSVVAAAYDPLENAYSGGLIRFDSRNGKRIDAIELYQSNITTTFGKASGFGEIMATCTPPKIEVGNLVWIDVNKNGFQDADEPGACDFLINLYDEDLNLVAQTKTDENGNYLFSDLEPYKTYFIGIDESNFVGDLMYNKGTYYDFTVNTSDSGDSGLQNSDIDFNGQKATDYLVEIFTQATSHNFDIGLIVYEVNDLALIMEYDGGSCSKVGNITPFKITVENQGTTQDFRYSIGCYLTPNYEFVPELNTAWYQEGNMAILELDNGIDPLNSEEFMLNLRLKEGLVNDYIIYAEIIEFENMDGDNLEDLDSEPDFDVNNDIGGQFESEYDDVMDDSGANDEDDHDPAAPHVFDLALKYEVENQPSNLSVGDKVETKVSVYNQGLITNQYYQLAVHLPEGMDFDTGANPEWTQNGDILYLESDTPLQPNYKSEHELILVVNNSSKEEIIWYAEIAEQKPEDESCDLDSTPDLIPDNDRGGVPNSFTDNLITDDGTEDEDDHDPIKLTVQRIDLALMKTTAKTKVKKGEIVEYEITIYNQGDAPVKQVQIIDYLAEETTCVDPEWNKFDEGMYTKMIVFEDGFAPGDKHVETILVQINANTTKALFENIAEIAAIYDSNGEDISALDIDSKSDKIMDNDLGGVSNSNTDNQINANKEIDEDDHDPALLKLIESGIIATECIASSATVDDGYFRDEIRIIGPPDEEWEVLQVVELYEDPLTDPPVLISVGTTLSETVITPGSTSYYTIEGTYKSGTIYTVRFINNAGDTEEVTNGPSEFERIYVDGRTSICGAATYEYSLTQDILGATYTWSLDNPAGGTINGSGSTVEIDWNGTSGVYNVLVEIVDNVNCYYIASLPVSVGSSDGPMACIGDLQLSLGEDCSLTVTPQMLSSIPLAPDAPYSVMLTDHYGNPIPNATLTAEHVGTSVVAKLIEACSGNSCWSTISIEDKRAPDIICENLSLPCYKIDDFFGPVVSDNCGGEVEMILLDSKTQVLTCDDDFTKYITNQYQAVDQYNNKSEVCEIVMSVERLDLDDIVFPEDLLKSTSTNLLCTEFDTDENGNPSPLVTGVPMIDDVPMYPDFEGSCFTGVGYEDRLIDFSGCVKKVMRTWTVMEGTCFDNDPLQYVQTIEIVDTESPDITCPENITASASASDCMAQVFLPAASAVDACSSELTYNIRVEGGQYYENTSTLMLDLPIGVHEVEYTAEDPCGNSDACSILVEVEDKTAPIVSCDQNTIVGLNSNGIAYLYANTIDDGSTDACGLDFMEIRRVEADNDCGFDNDFDERAQFCCNDVNQGVMVELRVWDLAGNYNSCMVTVVVQDKFGPILQAPSNIEISCEVDYDLNDLSEFGAATVEDACGASLIELTPQEVVDNCRVGYIIRTWESSDANSTVTASQTITIVNNDPFDFVIDWPDDVYVDDDCSQLNLLPENLPEDQAYPRYEESVCDQVGSSFKDLYFPIEDQNGACYKIIRTWTVIDDCQPGELPRMHDQVIMVSNSVAPNITGDCSEVPSVCNNDNDCDNGFISMVMTAEDDCTPNENLVWKIKIDTFTNGDFSDDIEGIGNQAIFSGDFPVGKHRVLWTFEDLCGNVTSCQQDFEVENCEIPLAVCKDTVSIALEFMNADGIDIEMACLTAESLNASSSHPCDYPLTFAFDTLGIMQEMCFSCFDIGFNTKTLYVIDEFGNYDFCEVVIHVQDNNDIDICPTFDLALIKTFNEDESTIQYGSDVTFDITVCNQGSESVVSVEIDDYIPSGYTLNDDDWSLDGNTAHIVLNAGDGIIPAGGIPSTGDSCIIVPITMTLNQVSDINEYINYAEITYGVDELGFTSEMDIDSEAGSNSDAENSVLPDDMNDNDLNGIGEGQGGDDDDHDPAEVPIFDLSLIKVVSTDGPFEYDDDVEFSIEVTNQGNIDANNLVISDYIPCGYEFNSLINPNWVYDDNTRIATRTVASLTVGNSTTISIFLTLAPCDEENAWVNYAEISSAMGGSDIDSTPDSDDDNDSGGVPDTDTDDSTDNTDGDEDDHDPALVEIFDLALIKTIEVDGPYDFGDQVVFDIQIFNQGNVDATDIQVVDYISCGYSFVSSENPDWSLDGDMATVSVDGTLAPGESTTVQITLEVEECGTETTLYNYAEIKSASGTDSDSTPDMIDDNDDTPIDDEINDEDDEDDHDLEDIFLGPCNVDLMAPNCSAKDTMVTLSNTDFIVITPDLIDNGSMDDCSTITYSFEPDTLFCSDEGMNLITMEVTDEAGNTSTCQSTITLDFSFDIECIQDTTIALDQSGMMFIDPIDFIVGDTTICGVDLTFEADPNFVACNLFNTTSMDTITVTGTYLDETSTCEVIVTVIDTLGPVFELDCGVTTSQLCSDPLVLDPEADDNCFPELITYEVVDSIISVNQCGIGNRSYTFEATDHLGNTSSCTAIIDITGPDNPFDLENTNYQSLPDTIVIDDCTSTQPGEIEGGALIASVPDELCALVSIDYNDTNLTPGGICQDTIERLWTVVDSCQSITPDSLATFYFTQILLVIDTFPPMITAPGDTLIELMTVDCEAFIDLSGVSVTDCSTNLVVSNNSPYSDDPNSLDASGTYPAGDTEITLTAIDDCGNEAEYTYTVTVYDTIGPMVECFKIFKDIEDDLMVDVFPEDFIFSITNDCNGDLDFSFSGTDPDVDIDTYDCDDLGDHTLFIYWFDGNGELIDSCKTLLTVLDPNDFCPMSLVDLTGTVLTPNGNPINNVSIRLEGSGLPEEMTDNGNYAFPDMPRGGEYTVIPQRDDEPLLGVSTLDLVLIQRHILKLSTLDSPYKLIAADINDDDKISASDLVELRKVILGILPTFKNNTSWKTIDARHEFLEPEDPFLAGYPIIRYIPELYGRMYADFTGVKIGDVNESVEDNLDKKSKSQSRELLSTEIMLEDRFVEEGEVFSLDLKISDKEFYGMQMALNVRGLEALDISCEAVSDKSFGHNLKGGEVKFNIASGSILSDETTVRIEFKAIASGRISELIDLDKVFTSELYTKEMSTLNVELRWDNVEVYEELTLLQNMPNPWVDKTLVDFYSPKDQGVELIVRNVDGKVLYSKNVDSQKGWNSEMLFSENINSNGVLIIEINDGYSSVNKRTILLNK